ncbi:MAG: hypothetical protein Alpg2KO_20290 [Alphaproteobacteria bacterium]
MEHHKENQIIDPDKEGIRRPLRLWQVGSIAIAVLGFATIIGLSYSKVQGNKGTDALGGPDYAKLIEAPDEPLKLSAAEYDAQEAGIEPARDRPPVGTVIESDPSSTASTGITRSSPRVERITAEGLIEEVAPLDVTDPSDRMDARMDPRMDSQMDPMSVIERAERQVEAEMAETGRLANNRGTDLEQALLDHMAEGEEAASDMIDEAAADAEAMADLIERRVETVSDAVETRITPPPPPLAAMRDVRPAPVATPRVEQPRIAMVPPPATPRPATTPRDTAPTSAQDTGSETRSFAAITIPPRRKPDLAEGAAQRPPAETAATATPATVRSTPPPPPPAAERRPPVQLDGWRIQFAAVGSKQDAEAEFHRLSRANPNTVGKLQMVIHQHNADDGRTFYRVQGGGLSETASRDMCEELKEAGVNCFVTRP